MYDKLTTKDKVINWTLVVTLVLGLALLARMGA